ncbi:prolactin-like [Entelurus aequoreus]|uniref:prolactin-like n=1 Tax=Entelurus aequoreus TaxID=161455 RepID=UPI002B1D7DA3|nr:prolactin-like [Entelurus aequoreus]
MTRGYLAVLTLLQLSLRVRSAPICAFGAKCHVPTLADVFERVIQQSSRMHSISSDLHAEFEQDSYLSKKQVGKWKCHTHDILAPGDKKNAQSLGREELTQVILRLLGAWRDPLLQLHQSMRQQQEEDQGPHSSNMALEMSDVIQELRAGVLKMADKMKLLGVLSGNTVAPAPPEGALHSSASYKRGAESPVDHNDLLHCLRRDSDKVKNYLRILQCSTLPGLEC